MAAIKTKFAVGLFVMIGFSLAAVTVIWIGKSHYLESGQNYVAYFDESVQGLNKDSPVKYRGVSIGRVESIGVAPDRNLIEVVLKIETGLKLEKDMVAQLKSVGITGIMFIELERKTDGEQNFSPKISFTAKYPCVATKPSEIKLLMENMNDVVNHIKSIDIKGISSALKSSILKIEKILNNGKMDTIIDSVESTGVSLNRLVENADTTVSGLNRTIDRIDKIIASNKDNVDTITDELNSSVKNLNRLLEKGIDLIGNTGATTDNLNRRLIELLDNVNNTGNNLNRLIEHIADQPSRLFFGGPPPARPVEPEPEP